MKKKKFQFLIPYMTHSYQIGDIYNKKHGNSLVPPSGLTMTADRDNMKSALSPMVSHVSYAEDVRWSRSSKDERNWDEESSDTLDKGLLYFYNISIIYLIIFFKWLLIDFYIEESIDVLIHKNEKKINELQNKHDSEDKAIK